MGVGNGVKEFFFSYQDLEGGEGVFFFWFS